MRKDVAGRLISPALLLLLLGCADGSPLTGASDVERDAPPFAQREVTWAQADKIHHGDRTFDVGGRHVRQLRVSAYGFFVRLADPAVDVFDGSDQRWHFFDGDTLEPLGADVDQVQVSPDGRLAGWVDRHGPLRPAGRIAKVVVIDVGSGEVLLDDHSGMGGGFGDDLGSRYSELAPTFLGFDDTHAYWTDAEGHGTRRRWEVSTGELSVAEKEGDQGTELIGHPYDAYAGEAVGLVDGKPGREGVSGLVSPDRSFVAEIGHTARLRLYDAHGERVPVDLGHRYAYLGGWLDGDRFYAMTRDKFEDGYDPTAPDRSRGFLTMCSLTTGACRDLEELVGTWTVVMPGSSPML